MIRRVWIAAGAFALGAIVSSAATQELQQPHDLAVAADGTICVDEGRKVRAVLPFRKLGRPSNIAAISEAVSALQATDIAVANSFGP